MPFMKYRIRIYRDFNSEAEVIDSLSLEKCRTIAKDCIDKEYGFQIEKYEIEVLSMYKPISLSFEKKSDGK